MSARDGAAVVGVGAAACAVCCAGPIVAFLGAIGVGTVFGIALFGVFGLLVAALAIPLLVRRWRRRRAVPSVRVPVIVRRRSQSSAP